MDRESSHPLRRLALAAVILAFAPASLEAREPGRFQHGRQIPDHPVEAVQAIVQDAHGFLWFGSEDALYRYDGFAAEVYRHDPDDPRSPSASAANDLLVDREGVLWIATPGGGLNRFLEAEDRFEAFRHDPADSRSLSHDHVLCLLEDDAGSLWIGTATGLDRLDSVAGGFTRHLFGGAGERHVVRALHEDASGILWIGTNRGLVRFDRQVPEGGAARFTHYRHDPEDPASLSDDLVRALAATPDGLWIGTEKGLNRFDPDTGTFQRYLHDPDDPVSLSYDLVSDLHPGRDGDLWVATFGGGLDRFRASSGRFEHHRHDPSNPDSLSGNGVVTLYEDATGILWLGTYGGLNKYDLRHEQFEVISKRTLGALALAVWEEASGVLWVGSTDSLARFDRARGTVERYEAGEGPGALPPGYVGALWKDHSGVLWVGSFNGLCRLDEVRGAFECYRHDPEDPGSLPYDSVLALFEDSRQRLWVGTSGGLAEVDRANRRFRRVAERPEGARWRYYGMAEEASGTLWFASSGGLHRLRDGRFETFRHDPDDPASLSSGRVVDVHVDRRGEVWAATWGGGLNRFDAARGTAVRYGVRDGLPSATVTSVLEDDHGNLWIGTYDGLSRFDRASETFQNFDVSDGLAGKVLNIYSHFRGPRGEMFFGTEGGLNAFFPDTVGPDPDPPPVAVTGFSLFDRPAPLRRDDPASPLERSILETHELVLTHRQSVFAFEFVAPHYRSPEKNRYAYRLEGFDRDWITTDARHRSVRYTNLDSGDYVFRVKASNASGVWNEDGAALAITVLPPPWKTWWAYSLYALASALVIAAGVWAQRSKIARERRRQQQEIEHERRINQRLREVDRLKDEFLANTSHELRTPLYGMIGLAEGLHDGARGELPEAARHDLAMLISSSRRLAALVNDILDFSRLRKKDLELHRRAVDLKTLVDVVLTISRPLADPQRLTLSSTVDAELPPVWADENRLQQILLNLVGNALKFTEKGSVEVTAERDGEQIRVGVHDTGIGIAPDQLERIFQAFEQADASIERLAGGTGLGLAVTEKLVALHGGKIWVESAVGEGSSFYFTLPIADAEARESAVGGAVAELIAPLPALEGDLVPALAPGALAGAPEGLRILVVDDEPVNRQVLVNHLATRNFSLTAAGTGPEALERLAEADFDLVLLDIMMPRMSGFEVCQRIRQQRGLEELPVIFLTAKSQTADRVEGFGAGANDYLVKPIAKGELLARVHTHLDLATSHRVLRDQHLRLERQAAELRERNAELVSFASAVSHDLKNPLTTIQLFLGLLEREIGSELPQARGSVEHIKSAAVTMERLMGDLVELARIGRQVGPFEDVDLREVVAEVAERYGDEIAGRRVALEIAADLPVVWGDRRRLREVIANLLDNSLKFLGEATSPSIEVGRRLNGAETVIFVRDNGIGVAPRYHERIFGIFEQLDPEAEGTGIGLAMARRVVELHGGRIWVESRGEGATFCFTLPGGESLQSGARKGTATGTPVAFPSPEDGSA